MAIRGMGGMDTDSDHRRAGGQFRCLLKCFCKGLMWELLETNNSADTCIAVPMLQTECGVQATAAHFTVIRTHVISAMLKQMEAINMTKTIPISSQHFSSKINEYHDWFLIL